MHKTSDKKPPKPKTNLKQLKNIIINSHTDVQLSLFEGLPFPNHSQQLHNPQSSHFRRQHPNISVNTVHQNQLINKKDSSKKLNLKDYIHLNSIERRNKNKSRSHNRHSKIQSVPSSQLVQYSSELPEKSAEESLHEQKQATIEVLKNQAINNIENQIKRLKDIERYMKEDYEAKKDDKQTELFLFGLCKSLQKTGEVHKNMGQNILEYQGQTRNNNKEYFWRQKDRQLESPAKMNVFKLSYLTYATFLEQSKQKSHNH